MDLYTQQAGARWRLMVSSMILSCCISSPGWAEELVESGSPEEAIEVAETEPTEPEQETEVGREPLVKDARLPHRSFLIDGKPPLLKVKPLHGDSSSVG